MPFFKKIKELLPLSARQSLRIAVYCARHPRERWLLSLYRKYRDYTMVPIAQFADNLALAERIRAVSGCIVECGCWKGGMAAAFAEVLGPERAYYLFDSFEGLPPARDIDGAAALEYQRDTSALSYVDNCKTDIEFARAAMALSGVPRANIIKGWFNETLARTSFGEPIALLRLDGDWYDSTMQCLQACYHRMAAGSIAIIDDYDTWEGCRKAVTDFFREQSIGVAIQKTPSGVRYFVRS